jgi:hypothetical protein
MGTLVSPWAFPATAPSPASPVPQTTTTTPSAPSPRYFTSPSASAQRQSNPLFLRVPIDLIYSILDHLDAPTVISLALTCKDLYAITASNNAWDCVRRPPPRAESPNRQTRSALLELLMKDMPRPMMNCVDCSILHHPRISWHGPGPLQHPWDIIGYQCAARPSTYRLQRLGLEDSTHRTAGTTAPSAPLPTSTEQHLQSSTWTVHSLQSLEVWLQVNWYAKIIAGSLYLKSVHGVRAYGLAPPQWSAVVAGLRDKHLPLCPHSALPDRCFVPALEIPHVRRGGCSRCRTEFQTVSIGQQSKAAAQPCGQFFVETYSCLGEPAAFADLETKEGWVTAAAELGPTEAWESDARRGYFHPCTRPAPQEGPEVKSLADSVDAITAIWREEMV